MGVWKQVSWSVGFTIWQSVLGYLILKFKVINDANHLLMILPSSNNYDLYSVLWFKVSVSNTNNLQAIKDF